MLLDVDGPLTAELMSAREAKRRKFTVSKNARADLGVRARFSRQHGPMLKGFAEHYGFELTWCTGWNHYANTYVSPAIGLFSHLPVIETPVDDWNEWVSLWKYLAVMHYAENRPLVWFDDEFELHRDARDGFLKLRADIPTLLIDVSPYTGLTIEHLREAREWKESL